MQKFGFIGYLKRIGHEKEVIIGMVCLLFKSVKYQSFQQTSEQLVQPHIKEQCVCFYFAYLSACVEFLAVEVGCRGSIWAFLVVLAG